MVLHISLNYCITISTLMFHNHGFSKLLLLSIILLYSRTKRFQNHHTILRARVARVTPGYCGVWVGGGGGVRGTDAAKRIKP